MSRSLATFALSAFIGLSGTLLSAQATPNTLERPISAGSTLRLKLSAGEYHIKAGAAQDKIRLSWRTERPLDSGRVEVSLESKDNASVLTAKAPRNKNFAMDIEVPARMDLDVDMSVGELSIAGVEGHKMVDLNIGEVRIDIGKPEAYQRARASLKIGEIDAGPFHARHEGFFRAFDWRGTGSYRLDVRLGIGEISLR